MSKLTATQRKVLTELNEGRVLVRSLSGRRWFYRPTNFTFVRDQTVIDLIDQEFLYHGTVHNHHGLTITDAGRAVLKEGK